MACQVCGDDVQGYLDELSEVGCCGGPGHCTAAVTTYLTHTDVLDGPMLVLTGTCDRHLAVIRTLVDVWAKDSNDASERAEVPRDEVPDWIRRVHDDGRCDAVAFSFSYP